MKLIKINTDHYVVVDDSEIKEGDFVLHPNGTIGTIKIALAIAMVEGTNEGSYVEDCKKITHSTQPMPHGLVREGQITGVTAISLQEVKELIGEVDVENRAESRFGTDIGSIRGSKEYDLNTDLKRGFIDGYNQALEDNKEKKYTEEDILTIRNQLVTILPVGNVTAWDMIQAVSKYTKWFDDYVESLYKPQTEWEVQIVDGKLKLK